MFFWYANFLIPRFTKASLLWTLFTHAFPGMFLKPFKKLATRVLSGFKTTRLRLVIKHCCSCFKHYIIILYATFIRVLPNCNPHTWEKISVIRVHDNNLLHIWANKTVVKAPKTWTEIPEGSCCLRQSEIFGCYLTKAVGA